MATIQYFVRKAQVLAYGFIVFGLLITAIVIAYPGQAIDTMYTARVDVAGSAAQPDDIEPELDDEENEWEADLLEDEELLERAGRNNRLVFFLVFVVAILGAYLLFVVVRLVMGYSRHDLPEERYSDYDEAMKEEWFGSIERKIRKRQRLGADMVVRAMFKRKVNEHRKKGLIISTSDTAKAISAKIGVKEDIGNLNALYHKVRYSTEKVSIAEIAKLRAKRGKV